MSPTPEASEGNAADSGAPAALKATGLGVSRDGKPVLSELSFEVATGEVYALLGANGAGKSTTLLTLLGFLSPTAGEVRVQGLDVPTHIEKVRQLTAYLPETAALYPHLSAVDNLKYFLSIAGCPREETDLAPALSRVGIAESDQSERLARYSKGMRQKVAIALSMLRDTPVLLLDEPTSGLDPSAMDELNRLIRSLSDDGRTILMVTHDVFGACHVADRIGFLQKGRLVGELSAPDGGSIDPQLVHSAFTEKAQAL